MPLTMPRRNPPWRFALLLGSVLVSLSPALAFTGPPTFSATKRNVEVHQSACDESSHRCKLPQWHDQLCMAAATGLLCGAAWLNPLWMESAHAFDSRVVGQIAGSGLIMKDTLEVESFPDPKVRGVTLYISNFQKPITERLSAKTFFNDPSSSAVACVKTGKVQLADTINKSPSGEEVFQESKSLLFKSLRVQRIYDEETQTLVYVSFNTRLDKNEDSNKSRFQNSLCAIHIN